MGGGRTPAWDAAVTTLDNSVDVALAVVAAGLHLGGAADLERLPPDSFLDVFLVVLPVLAALTGAGLLVVRGDRRGLFVACLLTWLIVLFTRPAFGQGLAFVPAAIALTVAARSPAVSSDRSVAG